MMLSLDGKIQHKGQLNHKKAILLKARNDFPAPLLNFVNAALPGIWGRLTNVFMTATASELIFDGILINCTSTVLLPRVICIAVEQNSKALVTLAKNLYLFSFFGGQNGTLNEYRLTVKRGRKDLSDVGRITQINGNTELPFWKGECNKIYGTDSTIFPPHRRRDNSSFTAYIPELCRVVKGSYVGDTVVNGIKGQEYIVSLGKGGEDPMTSCYCSRHKKCPPGAVDITPCLGAPLTATFPHFFDAPEFQNDVIGLNPDRAKHATYGILQEASGVPLRGRRRVQISIELKKIPYVGVTSKLKGYMCPLLWIEEAFDLEGDLLSMVKYQLVLGLTAMSAVKWGLLILGAGLSIFGGVGKFMNGPNWKKMGRENSPQNPPDLRKVEDGSNKRYRNLQDPKMEQQSRSIMFYKEKFRKADSSIQTEPLFFAVKNGRNLQPQKVNIGDRPTQRLGQDPSQTIIPLYSTEVEPDYQSQPILENNQKAMKSRIDSPGNDVDQRFPLLNIVNNDEVYGSQGSRQYKSNGINYEVRNQEIMREGKLYKSNVEDYKPKNKEDMREVSRYKSNGEDYYLKNQNIKSIGEQYETDYVSYDLKNQEIIRGGKQYTNESNGESYNIRNHENNIMRKVEQYGSSDVGYDLRDEKIMRGGKQYTANYVQNYDFRDREIMNERTKQGRYHNAVDSRNRGILEEETRGSRFHNDVDSRNRGTMEEETRGSRFHDDVDPNFGNRGIIEQGTRTSKFGNAGSRFENREILDEDSTNSRRNVVTRVKNDPKYLMQREENHGGVEDDSKLKSEIAKLNARLNVLERMKENLSRVPRDQPREDGGDGRSEKKGDKDIKVSERDDFGEENSRLEKEAEELGMDKRIFVSNQGGFLDGALKDRNLKLEEEARKLRVELNVLRGLKNGQFPLKNRRDDGVQTDETLKNSKIQGYTKNDDNNSTKGIIRKPNTTNTGLQSVVVPKPSVRFQHKVDLNGMHVGDNVFLESRKSLKTEGDDLGYELNSREKFFGRQGATDLKNFEKTVEISEEFGRIDRDAGRKSVIGSHVDISQRKVDTGDDDTKNTERVGSVVRYVGTAEKGGDIENNSTMKNGRGNVSLDDYKNMGRETYRERGSNVETGTNMEKATKNVQHVTKDEALNKNAGEASSTKPRESNSTSLLANKHIIDNDNPLSNIQKGPTLKMTLPESMHFSGSRHFENEVLKVLRGEMSSQIREYESLGGGNLKTAQKLLEPMEKVEVLSNILDGDNDKGGGGGVGVIVEDEERVGDNDVVKLSKKVEEISKTSSSSSESQEDLIDKFKQKVLAESEILRKKYYDQITTPPNKRRRIQISSSTEDTEETTLDEDSNMEELDEQLRKLSPETEKEEKDKLPDLKKVKIKKNWKKVLTIVHTSRQIYNYRQLEKRQLFGESVEDYLEDPQKVEDKIQEVRKISRSNSVETDSLEGYDSSRSIENTHSLDTPSLSRSIENTPSMTRRRPSLKYLERVESIESLLDGEGLSDARITVTGAFSGGILRRRLSRENSLSDENI